MKSPATVSPPPSGKVFSSGSRRDFLRAAAVGSAAVAIPSLLSSCKVGDTTLGTTGPTGPLLTIDFSSGDIAYLKFLSIYKQVQADLYIKTVAAFSGSDLTTAEQALITDIRNHQVIQRDTVAGVLGSANAISVTPAWGSINFKSAAVVMDQGIRFADTCIGLCNGMIQNLLSATYVGMLLEIHTVDARHSAALRDDLLPKSGSPSGFSPGTADNAYRLSSVGSALQGTIVEILQYTNAPTGL